MKKSFSFVIIILVIGSAGLGYHLIKQVQYSKENVPAAQDIAQIAKTQETAQPSGETQGQTQEKIQVPPELNLRMTFYPQAPFGDWGEPWQESCEEASILLIADAYYGHNWSREDFRDQILKLVDWENKTFGDYKNTNAQQIDTMLKNYLGLQGVIHTNPTLEEVQQILARGHLIVMTFDGKKIGNPFYTNGGPVYHAMVIKGYKEDGKIITEDVGTKHGEDYVYSWSTLYAALHDYTDPIDNGAKVMVEVLPPTHF